MQFTWSLDMGLLTCVRMSPLMYLSWSCTCWRWFETNKEVKTSVRGDKYP